MILQLLAVLVRGLMCGSELNVALFAHATLNRQPLEVHVLMRSSFAELFGRVMPFCMAGSAVLNLLLPFEHARGRGSAPSNAHRNESFRESKAAQTAINSIMEICDPPSSDQCLGLLTTPRTKPDLIHRSNYPNGILSFREPSFWAVHHTLVERRIAW